MSISTNKNFTQWLQDKINQRQQQQLYRKISQHSNKICFCSNDYLGLAKDPQLINHLQTGAKLYGVGGSSSKLIAGFKSVHQQLSQQAAELLGYSFGLIFPSGYMANLALMQTLLNNQAWVFHDQHNHASLYDGTLLAKAKFARFAHNDLTKLSTLLINNTAVRKLIVTEGVFSMQGDSPDLLAIGELAKQRDAWLMVDDSHGLGVLGDTGGGTVQAQQAGQLVKIVSASFGKACGSNGAVLATNDQLLKESIIQFARSYIYTTAVSPALCYTSLRSLQMIKEQPWRRQKLQANINYFQQSAKQVDLPIDYHPNSPIQPLVVGDAVKAIQLQNDLLANDLWVTAIRYPTVPAGQAMLRISLSAAHTHQQIDKLIEKINECY